MKTAFQLLCKSSLELAKAVITQLEKKKWKHLSQVTKSAHLKIFLNHLTYDRFKL